MKIKIFLLSMTFYLAGISSITLYASAENTNNKVKVCDDQGEWPPYVYYKRKGMITTAELTGYSVDLLHKIANDSKAPIQIDPNIYMVPWQRCLATVKNNSDGFGIVLEFSKTPEREEDYYLTNEIYALKNSAVFYNKKKYKKGLKINTLADLKNYVGCGVAGYNYNTLYNLKETDLDMGSKTLDRAWDKVKKGRCDFLIEKYEIILGFSIMKAIDLTKDKEMGFQILNMIPEMKFYMGISKKFPYAKKLTDFINKKINGLKNEGYLKELEEKYIGKI